MKLLTLIINTNLQQSMADQLRSMEQISGFTFNHVEGHGVQVENDPFLSARDKVVGYTPRIRIDILLDEDSVDAVLKTLQGVFSGQREHGVYWVTAVEKNGRL